MAMNSQFISHPHYCPHIELEVPQAPVRNDLRDWFPQDPRPKTCTLPLASHTRTRTFCVRHALLLCLASVSISFET